MSNEIIQRCHAGTLDCAGGTIVEVEPREHNGGCWLTLTRCDRCRAPVSVLVQQGRYSTGITYVPDTGPDTGAVNFNMPT